MQVRRLSALAMLPVIVAGGVVACGGDSDSSGSTDSASAVLSIGIGEPKHIYPANAGETEGGQVVYALFAGLMDYDEDGKPYNVIADSVTTEDSKTWTVKIKDGYTFHNGEAVTSQRFIDAWNWAAYGPNASDVNSYFAQIEGYEALNPTEEGVDPTASTLSGLSSVDDLTFTITLTEAFADFNTELGYTAFYPMPEAAFDEDGNVTEEYQEAPIGNGPFQMVGTWNHNTSIEVERFDGWKGTKPNVAGLMFKIYQDITTYYTDALSDNLDVNRTVDSSNLVNAEADFGEDHFYISDSSAIQYVGFPLYDPTYASADVRKAISMSIDRETLVDSLYNGTRTAADSLISPLINGYREGSCGEACTYDPEAAKALYQSAGGPSSIQITYNADGGHKEWIEAICNQVKNNLGVECIAQPEAKFADLLTKLQAKTEGVGGFRTGWVMDYPSMYDYLQPLFATNGSANYSGYSNAEFDALLAQGAAAATSEEAIELWQQAEDLLVNDLPYVPLRYDSNVYVTSSNVEYAYVNAMTWVNPYTIEAA